VVRLQGSRRRPEVRQKPAPTVANGAGDLAALTTSPDRGRSRPSLRGRLLDGKPARRRRRGEALVDLLADELDDERAKRLGENAGELELGAGTHAWRGGSGSVVADGSRSAALFRSM
jgi:hypothetical protein